MVPPRVKLSRITHSANPPQSSTACKNAHRSLEAEHHWYRYNDSNRSCDRQERGPRLLVW